jgi:sterol desaturase/sphingolipid hydroxylase (fatty acid hydroxylase superfamily)
MALVAFFFRFLQGGAVFILLERLFPLRPVVPLLRADRVNDVMNLFGNGLLLLVILRLWRLNVPDVLGWAKPFVLSIKLSGIVQVLAVLAVESFVYYWGHRLLHTWPLLWRFHAVHHSVQHLDWLAGFRGHVLETCYMTALVTPVMYLLNLSIPSMGLFFAYRFFEGNIEHSNVRLPLGPLKWVVPSPWFHHWHHAMEPEARNKNFSPYPIWDVIFGTAFMPQDRLPTRFGVHDPVPNDNYLGQVAYPFGLAAPVMRLQAWCTERVRSGLRLRTPAGGVSGVSRACGR